MDESTAVQQEQEMETVETVQEGDTGRGFAGYQHRTGNCGTAAGAEEAQRWTQANDARRKGGEKGAGRSRESGG